MNVVQGGGFNNRNNGYLILDYLLKLLNHSFLLRRKVWMEE